jgi:hypothetical protein
MNTGDNDNEQFVLNVMGWLARKPSPATAPSS